MPRSPCLDDCCKNKSVRRHPWNCNRVVACDYGCTPLLGVDVSVPPSPLDTDCRCTPLVMYRFRFKPHIRSVYMVLRSIDSDSLCYAVYSSSVLVALWLFVTLFAIFRLRRTWSWSDCHSDGTNLVWEPLPFVLTGGLIRHILCICQDAMPLRLIMFTSLSRRVLSLGSVYWN